MRKIYTARARDATCKRITAKEGYYKRYILGVKRYGRIDKMQVSMILLAGK